MRELSVKEIRGGQTTRATSKTEGVGTSPRLYARCWLIFWSMWWQNAEYLSGNHSITVL